MLLHQEYLYTESRRCASGVDWVCRDRKYCKAKLTTDECVCLVVPVTATHTHPGDPTEIHLLKARQTMKRKAGRWPPSFFFAVGLYCLCSSFIFCANLYLIFSNPENGADPPHRILLDNAASVSEHTACQMPSPRMLKRTIRRVKDVKTHAFF